MAKKISKVLVANRGEIALRIIRTVKEMGLDTVAVYEKPDSESYFLRFADQAILIGDGPRKDYLDIDKIIWAAQKSGADAIHPGYGFLSENPDLAAACGEARAASVSRELSKLHHETRRGSLEALAAHFAATPPRGEIVVVVGPAPQPDAGEQAADLALTAERLAGAGVRGRLLRDALSALGAPRNEAYRLALDHPDDAGGPE